MMNELQLIRRKAGLTQIAAAVRAGVSPPTVRNFERFGAEGVDDEVKRARLTALYDALKSSSDCRPPT